MLSPRSIALDGFGFPPRFVAVQGFVPLAPSEPVLVGPQYMPGRRNRPWPKRKVEDEQVQRNNQLIFGLLPIMWGTK